MATKAKTDGGIVETIKTIVYALLIAGVFRTLFFQPFWIPSGSMKDTLLVGDFLFVNKMAYGYSRFSCPFGICPINGRILGWDPERGDVVVFRHPVNGSDFIKRLIGLPGDTVQVKNGILFLNGTEVPQTPNGTFTEPFAPQGPMGQYPRCENGPWAKAGRAAPAASSKRCRRPPPTPKGAGTAFLTSTPTALPTTPMSSPCPKANTSSWVTTVTTARTAALARPWGALALCRPNT
jgi:signal peptidase I